MCDQTDGVRVRRCAAKDVGHCIFCFRTHFMVIELERDPKLNGGLTVRICAKCLEKAAKEGLSRG